MVHGSLERSVSRESTLTPLPPSPPCSRQSNDSKDQEERGDIVLGTPLSSEGAGHTPSFSPSPDPLLLGESGSEDKGELSKPKGKISRGKKRTGQHRDECVLQRSRRVVKGLLTSTSTRDSEQRRDVGGALQEGKVFHGIDGFGSSAEVNGPNSGYAGSADIGDQGASIVTRQVRRGKPQLADGMGRRPIQVSKKVYESLLSVEEGTESVIVRETRPFTRDDHKVELQTLRRPKKRVESALSKCTPTVAKGGIASSKFCKLLRVLLDLPRPVQQQTGKYIGPIPRPPVWAEVSPLSTSFSTLCRDFR